MRLKLKKLVEEAVKKGVDRDKLTTVLSEKGYNEEQITDVINYYDIYWTIFNAKKYNVSKETLVKELKKKDWKHYEYSDILLEFYGGKKAKEKLKSIGSATWENKFFLVSVLIIIASLFFIFISATNLLDIANSGFKGLGFGNQQITGFVFGDAGSFTGMSISSNKDNLRSVKVDGNSFSFYVSRCDEPFILNFKKEGFVPVHKLIENCEEKELDISMARMSEFKEVSLENQNNVVMDGMKAEFDGSDLVLFGTNNKPVNAKVSLTSFDITDSSDANYFPGDYTGETENGSLSYLQSFGFAKIIAEDEKGNSLDFKEGSQGMLVTFPIAESQLAEAPETMPLWYFDEVKGIWVEEGEGNKVCEGSKCYYVGYITRVRSYWNWDRPVPSRPIGLEDPWNVSDDNPDKKCNEDSECPDGQACVDGVCKDPNNCNQDSDCPQGSSCQDGKCKDPCEDCAEDEICCEGECRVFVGCSDREKELQCPENNPPYWVRGVGEVNKDEAWWNSVKNDLSKLDCEYFTQQGSKEYLNLDGLIKVLRDVEGETGNPNARLMIHGIFYAHYNRYLESSSLFSSLYFDYLVKRPLILNQLRSIKSSFSKHPEFYSQDLGGSGDSLSTGDYARIENECLIKKVYDGHEIFSLSHLAQGTVSDSAEIAYLADMFINNAWWKLQFINAQNNRGNSLAFKLTDWILKYPNKPLSDFFIDMKAGRLNDLAIGKDLTEEETAKLLRDRYFESWKFIGAVISDFFDEGLVVEEYVNRIDNKLHMEIFNNVFLSETSFYKEKLKGNLVVFINNLLENGSGYKLLEKEGFSVVDSFVEEENKIIINKGFTIMTFNKTGNRYFLIETKNSFLEVPAITSYQYEGDKLSKIISGDFSIEYVYDKNYLNKILFNNKSTTLFGAQFKYKNNELSSIEFYASDNRAESVGLLVGTQTFTRIDNQLKISDGGEEIVVDYNSDGTVKNITTPLDFNVGVVPTDNNFKSFEFTSEDKIALVVESMGSLDEYTIQKNQIGKAWQVNVRGSGNANIFFTINDIPSKKLSIGSNAQGIIFSDFSLENCNYWNSGAKLADCLISYDKQYGLGLEGALEFVKNSSFSTAEKEVAMIKLARNYNDVNVCYSLASVNPYSTITCFRIVDAPKKIEVVPNVEGVKKEKINDNGESYVFRQLAEFYDDTKYCESIPVESAKKSCLKMLEINPFIEKEIVPEVVVKEDKLEEETVYTEDEETVVDEDPVVDEVTPSVNNTTPNTPTTPKTCTSFTYSAWSECTGKQTRKVTGSSPSGCTGGTPVLSQDCIVCVEMDEYFTNLTTKIEEEANKRGSYDVGQSSFDADPLINSAVRQALGNLSLAGSMQVKDYFVTSEGVLISRTYRKNAYREIVSPFQWEGNTGKCSPQETEDTVVSMVFIDNEGNVFSEWVDHTYYSYWFIAAIPWQSSARSGCTMGGLEDFTRQFYSIGELYMDTDDTIWIWSPRSGNRELREYNFDFLNLEEPVSSYKFC